MPTTNVYIRLAGKCIKLGWLYVKLGYMQCKLTLFEWLLVLEKTRPTTRLRPQTPPPPGPSCRRNGPVRPTRWTARRRAR